MTLYNRLRPSATRLLAKYKQGVVEIGRPTLTPRESIYDPPLTVTTWAEVDAVVSGVSQQYVDGVNIVNSDRQVTTQIPDFNEKSGDQLRIDGNVVAILSVMPMPAAGDPVAVKLIVRG